MTYHSDIICQHTLPILYGPLMRRTLKSMDALVATLPVYIKTSLVSQSVVPAGKILAILL